MLIRDGKEKIEGSDLSEFEELLEKIQEQKPELIKSTKQFSLINY